MTWYKGRLYSASMLGTTQIEVPTTSITDKVPPTPSKPGSKLKANRFSGFTWNIGGLSNYKLDILKAWMVPLQLEVLMIQDTRWGFSGDWMDDHFAYIHSSSTAWSGGVLTIVRRSFCSLERIWRGLKEGRVLHVRLYVSSSSIDLFETRFGTFVAPFSRVHQVEM